MRRYAPAAPQSMRSLINNMWNANILLTGPALATALEPQIDALWTNSIHPDGDFQLQLERTQRNLHYTNGAGADEYPCLEEYAKQGLSDKSLDTFKIVKSHVADYASLLTLWTAPYLTETIINKYNTSHKQAKKLAAATASINGGGEVNNKHARWLEVIACGNYWIKEMPLINNRRAQLDVLESWGGGLVTEKFFRMVSTGEKDFVTDKKVISQGPTSFERHKWFYFKTGSPGVDHEWVLTINLKGPTITRLLAMAEEVSDETKKTANYAFLKKANEPNCIGIHEEFLEAFCAKVVHSITAAKNT